MRIIPIIREVKTSDRTSDSCGKGPENGGFPPFRTKSSKKALTLFSFMLGRLVHRILRVMRPSFAVEESVRTLGANLKAARLRRRLPQSVVAERAGISLNTLSKLENGDCGIAIGNVASVLQALGLGTPFSDVAAAGDDETGLMLEARRLPRRARQPKKEI